MSDHEPGCKPGGACRWDCDRAAALDRDPSVEEWKRTLMDKPLDPKVFHGSDPVNLPPHYRVLPVECIDVTEHFNFCMGNAIKYLWRADHKGNPIQDLEKAAWYIGREIERRKREQ